MLGRPGAKTVGPNVIFEVVQLIRPQYLNVTDGLQTDGRTAAILTHFYRAVHYVHSAVLLS